MTPITISLIAFTVIFLSALLGAFLRTVLPGHHLSSDSKDVIKLGTGMIATLAALVLGLLIGSAKASFDSMTSELIQTGAKVAQLDDVLVRYGPDAAEIRATMRRAVASAIKGTWPEDKTVPAGYGPPATIHDVQERLQELSPQSDVQRSLKSQAEELIKDIAGVRWLLFEQRGQLTIPMPFLIILVFWLAIIFLSFGLFSPWNATVIVVLFACALSAAGAIFLILEMDLPATGLIKVSDAPLRQALQYLSR